MPPVRLNSPRRTQQESLSSLLTGAAAHAVVIDRVVGWWDIARIYDPTLAWIRAALAVLFLRRNCACFLIPPVPNWLRRQGSQGLALLLS